MNINNVVNDNIPTNVAEENKTTFAYLYIPLSKCLSIESTLKLPRFVSEPNNIQISLSHL
jgi:hypothetical protein